MTITGPRLDRFIVFALLHGWTIHFTPHGNFYCQKPGNPMVCNARFLLERGKHD